uniref:Uncharacterized protein n=1 Tax=viral metagenome TaxID=1070528 RepID=A0A6C0DS82_9ZZZZ
MQINSFSLGLRLFIGLSNGVIFVTAFHKGGMLLVSESLRLQNIIANKAIISTVFNAINEEVLTDNYFLSDIFSNQLHLQSDISSVLLVGGLLYYRYQYVIPKIDKKLENIEYFYKIRRQFNNVIIFLLFLLVRNVGSAS